MSLSRAENQYSNWKDALDFCHYFWLVPVEPFLFNLESLTLWNMETDRASVPLQYLKMPKTCFQDFPIREDMHLGSASHVYLLVLYLKIKLQRSRANRKFLGSYRGTVRCSFQESRGRMIHKTVWSRDTSSRAECSALEETRSCSQHFVTGRAIFQVPSFCSRFPLVLSTVSFWWVIFLHKSSPFSFCCFPSGTLPETEE